MKFIVLFLSFTMLVVALPAQVQLPRYPDSVFSTYYHQRLTHFKDQPQTNNDIIFIGNSITDGGEWSELFNDLRLKNRGISGDISAGVLNRLDEVARRKPASVFLMIGVNDLAKGISPDSLVKNILLTAASLKQETPATKIFVQSILPVNDAFGKFRDHTNKGKQVIFVNAQLKQQASKYQYSFIDLYGSFASEDGKLRKEFTNDGLHLTGKGYMLWRHLIYPYVYELAMQPALLPMPQQLQWKKGFFSLIACDGIMVNDHSLKKEGQWLQKELQRKGFDITILDKSAKKTGKTIVLQVGKIQSPMHQDEAFQLEVGSDKVVLTANTTHGIFNGIQTMMQLARDGMTMQACTITDWPAFSWRGYMIDVGRNYMSMDLLKQQIDIMARYRLNVFHFHPTEDIAWRMAIRQYPQLTSPEHMLRDKGLYYSEEEIQELIAYCRDRHIIFLPEIDMPGHSAAFRRAMKTDMQSDSGLVIVKNILEEVSKTYDLPYIHIGADEVKITSQQFIPEVSAHLEALGKNIIGWEPGGNFTDNTIRQLWMDDNGRIAGSKNLRFIDSRHLYLNHMDPLESVVTIYNRKIGNKEKGDASMLGGTLCMWHDRAVSKDEDILRMNPVYPGMLAFAERTWRGGGQDRWVANISEGDAGGFTEFENRLVDHQKLFFGDKFFAYVKQSGLQWKLFGPFPNGGDVAKKFDPESDSSFSHKHKPYKEVKGGTIVLRHWWDPLIEGAISKAEDSTTWYATTKIWSDEAGAKDFWIGFNNLSRSPATDSPPVGGWDTRGSIVWVNGKVIPPPQWKRGGQTGHSEIPLMDEGYTYRAPTRIYLQKGFNTVLIKAPVKSFKGKDWQNPVKWMFTFIPLE